MAKRKGVGTTAVALVSMLLAPAAAAPADPPAVGTAQTTPPRILVENKATRRAIEAAGRGAAGRVGRAECARVVSDFEDAEGRLLVERLADFGQTPSSWVGQLVFVDGASSGYWKPKVMAFTEPGSRVVRVCPSFGRAAPELAETVLIHELLHTLGLEENPPSSLEITHQVRERCSA